MLYVAVVRAVFHRHLWVDVDGCPMYHPVGCADLPDEEPVQLRGKEGQILPRQVSPVQRVCKG